MDRRGSGPIYCVRFPLYLLNPGITHWSGSNVEFEENTQANNLYGCLGIGLRYSEILEFKSKDGGFPNYDHIRFLFYEKIRPRTLK